MLKCDRCRKETVATIMSMFNTEEICMECKSAEKAHPHYKRACEAERAAIGSGNHNFPGIGLPADLRKP